MASFRVLAVFDVGQGAAPVGTDILGPFWGGDLDFGYSDGLTLTVSALSVAPTPEAARSDVVARCFGAWSAAGGWAPLRPASVRVLPQVRPEVSA